MPILMELIPDESNYGIKASSDVITHRVEGGFSRFRKGSLKPPGTSLPKVSVTWVCDPNQYTYIRAFYRLVQLSAASFRINLFVDDPAPSEHIVQFVKGSMKLSSVRGLQYTVQAELALLS